MKLLIFLFVFTSLCRADENVLDTLLQIFEDEVEDSPSIFADRDETELAAYRRHRRRRIYHPPTVKIDMDNFSVGGNGCKEYFTATECEDLANDSKMTWDSVNSRSDFPKGCYWQTENDHIYFNTHASGKGQSKPATRPICKKITGGVGVGAIGPDPLDYISYENVGAGNCVHNDASITHAGGTDESFGFFAWLTYDRLCELACSYKDECTGFMLGEVEVPHTYMRTKWVAVCKVYGDWEEIGSVYTPSGRHWDGFSLFKAGSGAVTSGNGETSATRRNYTCYKKKVSTPPMPSMVSSCPSNKELVQYSNGGSACESPPDWNTAPCHKLKPSLNGDKNGYGCRGAAYKNGDKGGTTSSGYCKNNAWYNRCCTYDSDYDICYPKVFDCHIWPKRIYSNKVANFGWFHGPCAYAINSNGVFDSNRCQGGDSSASPSNEGEYMWFRQCCRQTFSWIENNSRKECLPKKIVVDNNDGHNQIPYNRQVYPRKKGETYYWN